VVEEKVAAVEKASSNRLASLCPNLFEKILNI
jgi:hypothetical protein